MNKILKKLLVFVLALGAAIVPFTAVVAADTEEEGIMKEEYIVGTVNAGCVIDAAQHDLNLHETLHNVRHSDGDYRRRFNAYAEKYALPAPEKA